MDAVDVPPRHPLTQGHRTLLAQADHIPIHVGAMPFAVEAVVEAFGDSIADGNVYLLNDPYHGGSHLPDFTVVVPIFAEGRVILYSVVRAHQTDIGGGTRGGYNPAATERRVDLSGYISRWIGDLNLDQYRWIVCVGHDEADKVRAALGAGSASVMGENDHQGGIPDPYELGMAGYRTAWLCWTR